MRRPLSGHTRGAATLVLLVPVAAACALAPVPGTEGTPTPVGELPPPGYGTLRQEDVSMSLTSGALELMVTPLHESVVRVTAPDTERRLTRIAETHRPTSDGASTKLFLISFYSEQPDTRFVPEEVQMISRGLRLRPATITAISPSWGQRRVAQRETVIAVYSFSGEIDLESEVTLAYGLEQTREWSIILPRIQTERARARARAGIGSPVVRR